MSPIVLRNIQILSHSYKIATKIDLMVFIPDPSQPFQKGEISFRKLGYLTLDSNEKNGYKMMELKKIIVNTPCLYLKLQLHKQYLNKFNLFN